MGSIKLVLALHNHQPVGNFDGVIDAAYQDAYGPILELLAEFPEIAITLHCSGSLMEWIVDHRPEYIERLKGFVQRGQIELLGGPFFEPIMAAIPRRDRVGQIKAYTEYLHQLFGVTVKGMWIPERVWEPTFAGDITDAGIDYTLVDDFHFRSAGLSDDELHGYYLTEDEGRLLKIFPDSEKLRYTIPYAEPEETIEHLRQIAATHINPVAVFGDDGEKFGVWPDSKQHCYTNGWLRRFFSALMQNRDWLQVVTLGQAVQSVSPLGKIYLPDASYREMTEWVLPTDQQLKYREIVRRKEQESDWAELKPFVRAGFWRNFLVKYPESDEMYCRMREVSRRLEEAEKGEREEPAVDGPTAHCPLPTAPLLDLARLELYRGQCNCPYWHGAFGGLYLPHLRNAIYKHLIQADTLLEQLAGRTGRWVSVDVQDFNLDARKEVRLAGDRLVAYIAPARGGHLYELDIRSTKVNLLATLNRRPEPYHQRVLEAGRRQHEVGQLSELDINNSVKFKQPDLDKKLQYDAWPRKSLVDHFLAPRTTLEEFQAGQGDIGSFVVGVYDARVRRTDSRVETILTRTGQVGTSTAKVTKTIALDSSASGELDVRYELEGLTPGEPIHFAVEWNFAALASGADDRYFYDNIGQQRGRLDTVQVLPACERVGLVDEWLGIDVALDCSQTGDIWTFPIQTVSQSEGGFELVHQSACVVPNWQFTAPDDGRWSVQLRMSVDTSVAQARLLAGQTR
jgi:alpha-amylase